MEHQTLAISPLVLTELDHLVHRGLAFGAAMQVMEALNARIADGLYRLAELRPVDMVAARSSIAARGGDDEDRHPDQCPEVGRQEGRSPHGETTGSEADHSGNSMQRDEGCVPHGYLLLASTAALPVWTR